MLTQFQKFAESLEISSQIDIIKQRQTSLCTGYFILLSKKFQNRYVRQNVNPIPNICTVTRNFLSN